MKFVLLVSLLALSSLSHAQCDRPGKPDLPDGDTSDLATMVEGQKAVKAFVAGTEAYLECLTAENEAAGPPASEEEGAMRVNTYNAAVDDMEAVATKFNEEIREYKARAE